MAQSQFPKMGEHPLEGTIVNMSGDRSPYTQLQARKGPSGDGESEPAGKRGQTLMNGEHNGPAFRPVTALYQQNAAEASAMQRNVRTVPSALGNRDFWDRRADESGPVIA